MRQEVEREMGSDSYLAARMAGLRIPPVPPPTATSVSTDSPQTLISEGVIIPQTSHPQQWHQIANEALHSLSNTYEASGI